MLAAIVRSAVKLSHGQFTLLSIHAVDIGIQRVDEFCFRTDTPTPPRCRTAKPTETDSHETAANKNRTATIAYTLGNAHRQFEELVLASRIACDPANKTEASSKGP